MLDTYSSVCTGAAEMRLLWRMLLLSWAIRLLRTKVHFDINVLDLRYRFVLSNSWWSYGRYMCSICLASSQIPRYWLHPPISGGQVKVYLLMLLFEFDERWHLHEPQLFLASYKVFTSCSLKYVSDGRFLTSSSTFCSALKSQFLTTRRKLYKIPKPLHSLAL